MGIMIGPARLLCNLKRQTDIDYSSVLMLGRQRFLMEKHKIQKMVDDYADVLQDSDIEDSYCEKLFSSLGAKEVNSMDASEYEGATVIHDLNRAIPSELEESYTCIVDGGTTEHIYDYPRAIYNVMKMLKVGGYYIGIVPTNNWNGHGFYQFSPMLYIQLFCENNNFELKKMYLSPGRGEASYLWEIVTTNSIERIEVNGTTKMLLCVVAKKTAPTPENIVLQQRDFVAQWKDEKTDIKKNYKLGEILNKIYVRHLFVQRISIPLRYYLQRKDKQLLLKVKI